MHVYICMSVYMYICICIYLLASVLGVLDFLYTHFISTNRYFLINYFINTFKSNILKLPSPSDYLSSSWLHHE